MISVYLAATGTAFGQKVCEFNIIGTWKAAGPNDANTILFRFTPDGKVTALSTDSSNYKEIASATYQLDNPIAPKIISFTSVSGSGGFAKGTTSLKITEYEEAAFTCEDAVYGLRRWLRVDTHRYFLVLAGRKGAFYDKSGPAFPMLIKKDERHTQVDAVGIYAVRGSRYFGSVPAETYQEFMKESGAPSDVMLRLAITESQYERGLKVLKSWERRAQEGALLYPDVSLDNILLAKQITESLNQCGEKIKVYKLDWDYEDKISDKNPLPQIPFLFFKEMRRLNESLHVRDESYYSQSIQ